MSDQKRENERTDAFLCQELFREIHGLGRGIQLTGEATEQSLREAGEVTMVRTNFAFYIFL